MKLDDKILISYYEKICGDLLNNMQEGVTGYVFHKINNIKDNFVWVDVSYTWYLNGHPKPVSHAERILFKEENKWKFLL